MWNAEVWEKVNERMLSDHFVRISGEEVSQIVDQTFIHLHFQDVSINTEWHWPNYTAVQVTAPLVSSAAVLLQPLVPYRKKCIIVFFFVFVGEEKLSTLSSVAEVCE